MPNELLSKTGIATLPFGSKDMACKNTWVEFSISVEDFLLCMGGADGGYATDKFTYAPNETKASLIIPDNGIIMRGGYSNSRNVYLESIKFDTSTAAQ